ncbi:MAG: serine/threonine-protein kinase [Verrucomicrobiota bacterium JB023]|nr:serine/threonine-protein kinase [Verrucomicrobiota bacterium JB023]
MATGDDTERLKRFLANELPPEEVVSLENELESNPDLVARLEELTPLTQQEQRVLPELSRSPACSQEVEGLIRELKNSPVASPPELGDWHQCLLPPQEEDGDEVLGYLGSYQVLSLLATGGMAYVFKARDPDLDRTVAIKLLAPVLASEERSRNRFLREARAAAAIEHPHILPIFDFSKVESCPWFVMPCVEGPTMADLLIRTQGPLPAETVETYARQMLSALAAAHEREIIHRDIKPANLLLSKDESHLWVADFGLVHSQDAPRLTRAGLVFGTPEYMSPEQIDGKRLDHRTDLFSAGAVLYQMATGTSPFGGPTTTSTMGAVAQRELPPLSRSNNSLPPALASLIDRLLAKNPEQRPTSANEALAQLDSQPPAENATNWPRMSLLLIPLAFLIAASAYWITRSSDQPAGEEADTTSPEAPLAQEGFDLAVAVSRARPGDVIEFSGQGRVEVGPISIPKGKPLTIRAKEGSTLTFVSVDASRPFLETQSALILENIRLARPVGTPVGAPLIRANGDKLVIKNGNLALSREREPFFPLPEMIALSGKTELQVTDSNLIAVAGVIFSIRGKDLQAPVSIKLERCALAAAYPIVTSLAESDRVKLKLTRSTCLSWNLISDAKLTKMPTYEINAHRNSFCNVRGLIWLPREKRHEVNKRLSWEGESNLYLDYPHIATSERRPPQGIRLSPSFEPFFSHPQRNEANPIKNEVPILRTVFERLGYDSEQYTVAEYRRATSLFQARYPGIGCPADSLGPR